MTIPLNKKLRLDCTFKGAQKMTVMWYKDGKQLSTSDKTYSQKATMSTCVLEGLHECNAQTTGRYACEITNKYGKDICYAQITAVEGQYQEITLHTEYPVLIKGLYQQYVINYNAHPLSDPARFVKKMKDVSISTSEKLKLECTFTGAPDISVTWYKNDRQLHASHSFSTNVVGNTCLLECLQTSSKDTAGTYSCQVSNKYGAEKCQAQVTVVAGVYASATTLLVSNL